MAETILSSPLFAEVILPFILVFVLIFAILQKSEIFGKGKKQIDALVSLALALMVVSFSYAVGIITSLAPFLAVSAVIILIFMVLFSMFFKHGEFKIDGKIQWAGGILVGIALIIAVLVATGAWDYIAALYYSESGSSILTNIIFIVIILVAVIAAVNPFGKEDGKKS